MITFFYKIYLFIQSMKMIHLPCSNNLTTIRMRKRQWNENDSQVRGGESCLDSGRTKYQSIELSQAK